MCRHLAYVGAPVRVRALLFDAPYALVRQARMPRYQYSGPDNPHGWGVAWYEQGAPAAEVYRSSEPIWNDTGFTADPRAVLCVAAARKASPGTTDFDTRNNAPFIDGPWLFSLNGWAFAGDREEGLRARLSPERAARLRGDTDSEVVFGLILDELATGEGSAEAVAKVHAMIEPEPGTRVNLLLATAGTIVATAAGNSLFTVHADDDSCVASEPLDDSPAWTRVPDGSLVEATADSLTVTSL